MPWKECSVMDERLQFVARRLAVVYWEFRKQSGKQLIGKKLKEWPAYYPLRLSCSASKPSSLAKLCWASVSFERTRATRLGAFSS